MLAGNIFIIELREEFSVGLNNEAGPRVRVYLYKLFYSRERKKCQTEGNNIVREQGNK